MTTFVFTNQANSTLASGISAGSTSVTVAPGDGAKFPNPGAGESFPVVFKQASGGTAVEVAYCTSRTADVLTITRGQEGTAAQSWGSGDILAHGPTAGTMQNMGQIPQVQAGAPNYAVDTGAVNAYAATFSPPISTRVAGLKVWIKATASNTGDSTVNLGAGSIQITNPDGSVLGAGAILGGGVFEVFDTGSGAYQLLSQNNQAQSAAGGFSTGGVQWRPTSESLTGWVPANANTIGNASSNGTSRANADTSALFEWHWNNFSNTTCPVYTSGGVLTTRGANAAADFAANKAIQTYDMRGTGIMGVDTMGGAATTRLTSVPVTSGNATTPGSVLGENLHVLITAELAAHAHSVFLNDPGHSHTNTNNATTLAGGTGAGQGPFSPPAATITINANTTGITVRSASGGGGTANVTASAGSDTAHNTVQRSAVGYFYLKL